MSTQHPQYVLLFSTGGKFRPVSKFYGELHTLSLAVRSYAFLLHVSVGDGSLSSQQYLQWPHFQFHDSKLLSINHLCQERIRMGD